MSYHNSYTRETVSLLPSAWIWTIVGTLLFIVSTTMVLMVKPAWMGFEREIVQESPQYVEGKRTLLNSLMQDYYVLETRIQANPELEGGLRGQQIATLNRMRDEVQRIPESEVPPVVSSFLSQHPR